VSLLARYQRRAPHHAPWHRLWTPRGAAIDEDGVGFLAEPTAGPFAVPRNRHLRALAEFDPVACVVALGDPSLGKSWELEAYVAQLATRLAAPPSPHPDASAPEASAEGEHLIAIDAAQLDSMEALHRQLLGADAFVRWCGDPHGTLHLVVDSLDEASMGVDLLCDALLDRFETLSVERLRLRVACRTAVLPASFREGLQRRFTAAYPRLSSDTGGGMARDGTAAPQPPPGLGPTGDGMPPATGDDSTPIPASPLAEVELVPLRRADVRAWAEVRLGSSSRADTFMAAVLAADVGAFAARPQTLAALLERYASGDALDVSQVELYRTLCRRLCDPGPVRPGSASGRTLRTTVAQRYQLAGRIAAAILFGNRQAIWLGYADEAPDAALAVPTLTGAEQADGAAFSADEAALWEAVDTGVFTGAAETALVTHQTFAEFLAAEWVTSRALPLAQVRALLADPTDPGQRVVPQLRQLAAWLSALRPDVFEAVARAEPDLVLWSDVVQLPADRRPALVDALLAARTANRVVERPYWTRRRFEHLTHAGLAGQLAPVIADRTLPERTRDLALDIGRACSARDLAPEAAELALDPTEPLGLRVGAAYLVASHGSDVERLVLAPLLEDFLASDDLDDLRGAALLACWRLLTPDEVFGVLTPLKRGNYGGAYGRALLEIAAAISPEYARAGAQWLTQRPHDDTYFDTLSHKVLRLAVDAVDDPPVAVALGRYAVSRLREHEPLVGDRHGLARDELGIARDLVTDAGLRRRVLRAIVEQCSGPEAYLGSVTYNAPYLFTPDDVPWGIAWLADLPPEGSRRAPLVTLLRHVFDGGDASHVEAAFAHSGDPDVGAATGQVALRCRTPARAVAATAWRRERARARMARRQAEWDERRARRAAPDSGATPEPLAVRVAEALHASGSADAQWFQIFRELMRVDAKRMWEHVTEAVLGGIRDLSRDDVGGRVAERAAAFLRAAVVPEDPFPDGRTLWYVVEGIVALAVLRELAPGTVEALEPAVWRRWMRALVGYWATGVEEEVHAVALRRAAELAPDVARDELVRHWDAAAGRELLALHGTATDVAVQVPGVGDELARRVDEGTYPTSNARSLLHWLVAAGNTTAVAVARRLLCNLAQLDAVGDPSSDARVELALAAGAALLERAPTLGWEELWAVFRRSDAHARALLSYTARSRDALFGAEVDALTDAQIADTYRLVERLYPPDTDPVHVGAYSPGPRENLGHWRGALLRTLEARNTPGAVAELERLARREPVRDGMVQLWLRAEAALRGVRWRGIAPRDLMALAERAEARLVTSSVQLLAVVEESLARLQDELQGQWRSVVGLWNESAAGSTPKSEEHLSNEIARHLRRDLADRRVVIGRELRVQLGTPGGNGGLRTDIEVYAPAAQSTAPGADTPRVIIEVKGSWNPEVLTAIRAQLVGKYLAPHAVRAGLYVVGWYTCTSWKRCRARQASERLGRRDELEAALAQQAAGVSTALHEVHAVVLDTSLPAPPVPLSVMRGRGRAAA